MPPDKMERARRRYAAHVRHLQRREAYARTAGWPRIAAFYARQLRRLALAVALAEEHLGPHRPAAGGDPGAAQAAAADPPPPATPLPPGRS